MRTVVLLTLLVAGMTAVVATPAQAAARGCDLTGDTNRANDCIAHSHVGATADGQMRRGDTITIREQIADGLRGKALVVEVQMRRVSRDGTKGPWVGLRRTRWAATATAAHSTRTVDVCRAGVAGRYQFRTATRLPRPAGRSSLRQLGATTATSAPTTVTLPNRALAGACPNSPEDESIIEYFNQIEFSELISIVIEDQGTSFSVTLSCPPQQSPSFPPPNFGLALTLEGGPAGIGCNGAAIVLSKSTLGSGRYAGCATPDTCTFDMLAYNESTQVVYSDTLLEITFTNGNNTYTPNLNPATLPLCPSTFNPCVLEGTCPLSTSKTGALSLCDNADSATCSAPPTNNTYAYNENVYFQTLPASSP